MQVRRIIAALACGGTVVTCFWGTSPRITTVAAQNSGVALSGIVSSREEGNMEGVIVTARREYGSVAVSVVSDSQGKYSFPATHLKPGTYTLKMRAIGYDLSDPGPVTLIEGKTAMLDLALRKTADLSRQLTSVEWLMSVKGTDQQKAMVQKEMESCTYCHTLELPIKSKHTAAEFIAVITRMFKYHPDGSAYGFHEGRGRRVIDFEPELRRAEGPIWSYWPTVKKTDLAKYLAEINMSGGKSLPTDLKTLPRPKGKATRIIITEYDMPRRDTHPHDSDVDRQGRVWYNDQSAPYIGMFDPKTTTFTEYRTPESKRHPLTGVSDPLVDKDGNVWAAIIVDDVDNHFGAVHKLDPRTKTFTRIKTGNAVKPAQMGQFLAMGADGTVWGGGGTFFRIDTKAVAVDMVLNWTTSPVLPKAPFHIGYELAVDPQGNPWVCDYSDSGLVKMDAKTKEVKFYPTITPNAAPRRGVIDRQGRFWFGEYTGDKLGMLDTNTGKLVEYDPGIKWFGNYTASDSDKFGRAYSPSNSSDRVMRADSRTGEVVVYLWPTQDFDTKEMRIDPIDQKTVWFVNTRTARVAKMEPLD
jgi:virginiamycin B lyase